jgi:hypothetical protein
MTQLSHLQAAFSNDERFDFLSLPLEIRIIIYKEVLKSRKACFYLKHKGEGTLPGLPVMTVNKQVYSEA